MLDFRNLLTNVHPSKDAHIEIEVKFKTKPFYKLVKQYNHLRNVLRAKYPEVVEESTVNQLPNNVRQIISVDKTTYQQKRRLNHDIRYQEDYGFVVTVSEEINLPNFVMPKSAEITNTRHRLRHKFQLSPEYEVDLTEVTSNNNKSYEMELEYIGDISNFTEEEFITNIKKIYNIINNTENFVTAQQIASLIEQVNKIFGSDNTKKIDKSIFVKARNIKYIDLIYGGIVDNKQTSYVVTHKADGERHFLIYNHVGTWLVSTNDFNLLSTVPSATFDVFECEVIKNLILVYDTLVFNNKDIRHQDLAARTKHIVTIVGDTATYSIKEKPSHLLTLENYFDTMKRMFEEQLTLDYPQDGFIFTPTGIYNSGSDQLPLFKRKLLDYPDVCKWKPPHKLTIDFRVVTKHNQVYLLVYNNKNDEIPFEGTQLAPLLNTMIDVSLFDAQYQNQIVECSYDNICQKMKPIRLRLDKSGPNKLDIAEANWHDAHDPILPQDLTGESLELVKKYHNQIKNILYGLKTPYPGFKNLNLKSGYDLLDIGGGRGGDLQKWVKSGAEFVITVEPNIDNIKELNTRLKNSELEKRVIPLDTYGEDTQNITDVVKHFVGKVNAVSLMLSLSFFWASETHLDALVNTIVQNLNVNGLILFFTIDGKYLREQFNKFHTLHLNNATFQLYDQKLVRVSIPGIVGKQWEFLVDLDTLTKKLQKYGIVLKEQRRATDELLLSPAQKTYSSLFTYGYYQKIKNTKLPPITLLKLPKIVYPTIKATSLNVLSNDKTESIKNTFIHDLQRIGVHEHALLHAILKAYASDYQETNNVAKQQEIVDNFRIELSEMLTHELWLNFEEGQFPTLLLQQLQSNNALPQQIDYSVMGLKYYLQSQRSVLPLLNFVAFALQCDIYIFTYDDDLVLSTTTFNCQHNYEDAIILLSLAQQHQGASLLSLAQQHQGASLLSINNNYEVLGERTKLGIKTIFNQHEELLPQLYLLNMLTQYINTAPPASVSATIKQTFPRAPENLQNLLSQSEPLYKLIESTYKPPELYVTALIKTIKKVYAVKGDIHDKVERLFGTNSETEFAKLLKTLKRMKKNPQRVEERVQSVSKILETLHFDTVSMKVLDIGAGNGEIITAVQEYYHLPAANVYAIDTKLPKIKNITPLVYTKDMKIPLPDESIDLILLFAVLHHIPPDARENVMNEVQRVIAPGGLVIIREHDDTTQDAYYLKFIELIHMFWYLAENELEDPLHLMTHSQTQTMFAERGFTSVFVNYYNDPNPQRLYYQAFQSAYDDFPYKKYSIDPNDVRKRFNNLKRYKFETIKSQYVLKNIPGTWYQNKKLKYNNLLIVNKKEDYLKYNLISDYFMDECRMRAKRFDQPLTPIEYWQQNKDYVYEQAYANYDKADDYTLRETIYNLAGEVTSFRPAIAVGFFKLFKAKRVLDFSSGWGDRLVAAMASNLDFYCGVDPNPCLFNHYQQMIEFFDYDKTKIQMIESPFETATLPTNVTYNLVLTSPPYFNLEVYSDNETQSIHQRDLNAWFDDFLIESLNKAWSVLEKGGQMVIIINDIPGGPNYTELMVTVFNDLHEDATFLGVLSYSELVDNKPKNPQPCWIWLKV